MKWCFVDPNCYPTIKTESSFLFGETQVPGLIYSYETCDPDSPGTFAKWAESADMNAYELKAKIESYVDMIARTIQTRNAEVRSAESLDGEPCIYIDSCGCASCRELKTTGWVAKDPADGKLEADLSRVSLTHPIPGVKASDSEAKIGQCLAGSIEDDFMYVVKLEYSDPNRIGYMYYGNQNDGIYFQWPAMEYCPSQWDPRYRPWYVNVVTGPKDIIVVLDVSGSMSKDPAAARNTKALEAMERLMLTLTDKDYAGLVLFNDRAYVPAVSCPMDINRIWCVEWDPAKSSVTYPNAERKKPTLVPMTDGSVVIDDDGGASITEDNKGALLEAARKRLVPKALGGTNFYAGLKVAFDMLEASLGASGGITSSCQICDGGCNQMILFMTDGLDGSGRPDLLGDIQDMQELIKAKRPNKEAIPIYTYTFGAEALEGTSDLLLSQMPKKIACQNLGVAYTIEDGADLASVMTDYYKYFIWGMKVQDAMNMKPKWIKYTDSWVGEPLLAGCKAVFDDEQLQANNVELLGVACMDMNVIVELMGASTAFINRALYSNFVTAMNDEMGVCFDVKHDFADMQQLRRQSIGGSICESCDMKPEPCALPPSASDDEDSDSAPMAILPLVLLLAAARD
jgi:hypothetical protein